MTLGLVVDDLCVFFVRVPVVGTGAVLQLGNGVGCPHVLFTASAPCVFTAGVEHGSQHRVVAKRCLVHAQSFFGNFKNANALHAARCASEVLVHGFGVDANGFKQLRTAIRHVGADTHLGHDLGQALTHRFDVVVDGFISRQISWQLFVQSLQSFHGQVGVNGFCAVTCQHRKVMHLAGCAGFHHQASRGAQAFAHQVLVNSRQGQQCRDGHLGGCHAAVADDQNVVAAFDGVNGFCAQRSQLGFNAFTAPSGWVSDV